MRKQYVKVHISGTPIVRHLRECPVALYEIVLMRGSKNVPRRMIVADFCRESGRPVFTRTVACASSSAEMGVTHDSNRGAYPLGLFSCRLGSLSDRFANDPLELFDRVL